MNFNSYTGQLFAFLIYFSTLAIYVKSANSNGALTFNPEKLILVNIEKQIQNRRQSIKYELATACPAQSSHEMEFNRDHSLGKNCLFVKGTYDRTVSPSEVSKDICDHVYKMSISYHKTSDEFFFGYEVYYDPEMYKSELFNKDFNYANFVSVEKAYSETNSIGSKSETGTPKLQLEQDGEPITLGFLWILQARLKFENSIKRAFLIEYSLSKGREVGVHCNDYSLGKKVYEQEETENDYIDSLYLNNQVSIFDNVKIPESDFECDKENDCLTKYSLIPAEEFRFSSPQPKSISCSNLTTVPVWKSTIQEVLEKLDKFLYALVQFAFNGFTVISGVQGQLKMRKKRFGIPPTAKISLGNNGEIPVPNIIYKIVKYEYQYQSGEILEDVRKAVIIAIHNDPQFHPYMDALCSKDNCEEWGWGEILNKGMSSSDKSPSNHVYCCPMTKHIMNKLELEYEQDPVTELNLNTFLGYDNGHFSKKPIENLQEKVLNKMNSMFGEYPIPEGVTDDEMKV